MVHWVRWRSDGTEVTQSVDVPSPTVLFDNKGLAHRVDFRAMSNGFYARCDTKFYWWLGDFTESEFVKIVAMTPSCIACLLKT